MSGVLLIIVVVEAEPDGLELSGVVEKFVLVLFERVIQPEPEGI